MNKIQFDTNNYVELHLLDQETRPLILIAPGGGYRHTSKREAMPIVELMNSNGFHAAIVYYRETLLTHEKTTVELAQFVSHIKKHSSDYHIAKNKVILMGFSSGGHYVARLGVLFNQIDLEARPDGLVLAYPVISGKKGIAHEDSITRLFKETTDETRHLFSLENFVSTDTPKTFLFHTIADQAVCYQNSLVFFEALNRHQVKCELHLYDQGEHGLSLGTKSVVKDDYLGTPLEYERENAHFSSWANLLISWLNQEFN